MTAEKYPLFLECYRNGELSNVELQELMVIYPLFRDYALDALVVRDDLAFAEYVRARV